MPGPRTRRSRTERLHVWGHGAEKSRPRLPSCYTRLSSTGDVISYHLAGTKVGRRRHINNLELPKAEHSKLSQ